MTTEHSGSGDPAKSIELLWGMRPRPSRGPRPGLSVPRIVGAAIEVADAEGLGAMSIRRVADALGVGTMTLYRYLPGKAELVDVMVDTVYGELPYVAEITGRGAGRGPVVGGGGAGWRSGLEAVARDCRELYRRHPWLLQVAVGRPVLGPNAIAKYEAELRTVEGVGLTDLEMDAVVTLVGGFVHGAARGAIEAAQAVQRTGMSDEEWWRAHEPVLARMFDAEAYPVAARVGAAAGAEMNAAYDPDRAFEFGLARVLDGVQYLLAGR